MGYQQGLSGLAGASNALDVIGNNIANANTVGFKSSTAQFADMYANSVATSTNTQIGIGTSLNAVQQNFGRHDQHDGFRSTSRSTATASSRCRTTA